MTGTDTKSGSGSGSGKGFLDGFVAATVALGVLILLAWAGLWGLEALGGPDWRMPLKLLYSGFTLITLGALLRTLFVARKP